MAVIRRLPSSMGSSSGSSNEHGTYPLSGGALMEWFLLGVVILSMTTGGLVGYYWDE